MPTIGPTINLASIGPSNIPTASYSNFFVVGQSPWGQANVVTRCTSFAEWLRLFGGLNRMTTLGADGAADTWTTETDAQVVGCYYGVKAYFEEKGPTAPGILYYVRVVQTAAGPTAASRTFTDGAANNTTITSKWVGDPGETVTVLIDRNAGSTEAVITVEHPQAGIREVWTITNAADAADASKRSQLVTITLPAGGQLPADVTSAQKLGNGSAATADAYNATTADYVGTITAANVKTGLRAFDDLRFGTGFVSAPGIEAVATPGTWRSALLTHCETHFRMGLVSSPSALVLNNVAADVTNRSSDLIYYWPQVWVPDEKSSTGGNLLVGNSGHIAGLAARMDGEYRGPHKSPAGIDHPLRTAVDVEAQSTGQELTDDAGSNTLAETTNLVNTIRRKQGSIVVWGMRTRATNETFRQINARRVVHVVYHSILSQLERWTFEPITDELMARAESTIKGFLKNLWRDGVLYGKEPGHTPSADDAYQVVCSRANNTRETIGAGQLVLDVVIVPTLNVENPRVNLAIAAPGFARAAA